MKQVRRRLAVLAVTLVTATIALFGIAAAPANGWAPPVDGCLHPVVGPPCDYTSPTLQPGEEWSFHWHSVPTEQVHAVDLSPIDASSTTPCKFQVVRQWDQRNSDGNREFSVLFKNVGSIACKTKVLLISQETIKYGWSTGSLTPGQSTTMGWNNTPLENAYFAGVSPQGATSTSSCKLQVTRQWYRRLLNDDGSWEREFYFTIKNIGSITCWGYARLGYKAAASGDSFNRTLDAGASEWWYWNNNPPEDVLSVGLRPYGDECRYELLGSTHVQQYKSDGTYQQRLLIGYKNLSSYRCEVKVYIAAMPSGPL